MLKPSILFTPLMLAVLCLACHRNGTDRAIKVSGNIEVVQTQASFRVAGRVAERLVDEGQMVQEGQLLARLEDQDLQQQLAIRQADAATAQAVLRAALAGSRREEVEASRQALEQARADLRRTQDDEKRYQGLHDKGIVSDRDYQTAREAFLASQAKARQAEQQYELVRKGPRSEDIDQVKAKAESAQKAFELARTQAGYALLTAPTGGVILSKNVEPREYVSPGTAVVTIGNLQQVWLRAYVEETDLGRVKVGQAARLRSDSYPGKVYQGRVSFISSEAEFTPKSVQTQKERVKLVYRIKIDVPNPAMELKPGMPADAEIILENR
ncbi:efflux RND transporter periplasmic adaptor subunit [Holophaga foetida]|uniref:efflux RND transporter periplasmic adaptor subunit n=1 Tax=Holophaga foetida TaxID=35839 RepID=UPI0002473EB4|nr:efflux RND transporter periplasmic adaptor subunit [Holophaga foetida]